MNKNISILMLFDCMRVNTGLGSHWICNSEKKRVICELMMLSILNHFSLFDLLVVFDWWKHINMDVTLPFWVIVRSERGNVMKNIPTKGGTIFGRRGAGNSFTMSHTATRGSSWPYMDFKFLWRQFRGWDYALIWHMGGVYPYMGPSTPPQVFRGTKMS